jgi:hypothetical protein
MIGVYMQEMKEFDVWRGGERGRSGMGKYGRGTVVRTRLWLERAR